MATEKFANNAQSSLTADVSNVATSVSVLSGTTFPAAGNFRILIDAEIMLVTVITGGTTFTVTRAQEGTVAVFHANGSLVSHLWTAGALNQSIADCCQVGTSGSLPAAEKAGRLYFETDTLQLMRDNGSAWVAISLATQGVATATDGSTITFDLSQGRDQQVQLGGDRTLALSNEPATGRFAIILQQPSSGGPYSVTWWSGILWANGVTPTLTATASKRDVFVFVKTGSGVYLGMVGGQNF